MHKPRILNSLCSNIKIGYLARKPKKNSILHCMCLVVFSCSYWHFYNYDRRPWQWRLHISRCWIRGQIMPGANEERDVFIFSNSLRLASSFEILWRPLTWFYNKPDSIVIVIMKTFSLVKWVLNKLHSSVVWESRWHVWPRRKDAQWDI